MVSLLALPGYAQPAEPPAAFTLPNDVQVFNLKMIDAFPFIAGSVNGQTGYFMFDTGNANRVVLNNHYLKLPPGQAVEGGFVGSGQHYTSAIYATIDSLRLGDLRYRNLPNVKGNSLDFLEHIAPDCLGQVGFGFMEGHIFKLDYTQRRLTCYRATAARRANQDFLRDEQVVGVLVYEVRKRPNDPFVHVKLGAGDFLCEFDTGQQGNVYISASQRQTLLAQRRLVLLADPEGNEQLATLRGADFGHGLKLDLHAIYIQAIHNQRMEKALGVIEANFITLGYAFFSQFTTIWDTQEHKIYLCRPR